MRVRFDKIDRFIRVRGSEFEHLVFFDNGLFDKICDKIKYLITEKSDIADSINHNFGETKLIHITIYQLKKILAFHNVIIFIKSVVNKNKNNYYYNIFPEKGWYKDKSNKRYF